MKRLEKQLKSKANIDPFCKLILLTLDLNSEKGLRVSKIVQEINFGGVWGELESRKIHAKIISHKIFDTNSRFNVKERTTGQV